VEVDGSGESGGGDGGRGGEGRGEWESELLGYGYGGGVVVEERWGEEVEGEVGMDERCFWEMRWPGRRRVHLNGLMGIWRSSGSLLERKLSPAAKT